MWKCVSCGSENEDSIFTCKCVLPTNEKPTAPKEQQTMKEVLQKAKSEVFGDSPIGYRSTYRTARTIAQIVSFIGWFTIASGIFVSYITYDKIKGTTNITILSVAIGVFSGLILVMIGQMTRATVDTADNTGEMLDIMKNKNRQT